MSQARLSEVDEDALLAEDAAELGLDLDGLPTRSWQDVTLAEGRIRALRWGEGPPELTLLHGGGMNALTWNSVLLLLAKNALALDLPGHGDSDWRADADYGPERLAPGVAETIGQLAPGPRVLVGHSLGGLTAIGVAARRPELVSQLVLIDVTPGIRIGGGNQVRDFLAGPESFASIEEVVERARAHGLGRSASAIRRGALRNTRIRPDGRMVWKHHLGQLPAGVTPSWDFAGLWQPLGALAVPITLIAGERGYVGDEQLAEFGARLPSADVVVLPTGHNVHQDDPAALAEVLGRLLER